jgi:hypothetical protein
MPRKKKVHGRDVGLTEQRSEDDTQFPGGWIDALDTLKVFNPSRAVVIAG